MPLSISHAYCDNCKAIMPVNFEGYENDDVSKLYKGGDVVCRFCAFVITTLYRVKGLAELCSL